MELSKKFQYSQDNCIHRDLKISSIAIANNYLYRHQNWFPVIKLCKQLRQPNLLFLSVLIEIIIVLWEVHAVLFINIFFMYN